MKLLIIFFAAAGLTVCFGKNIVNLESYKDENGEVHKRLLDNRLQSPRPNMRPVDVEGLRQKEEVLKRRDNAGFPLNLETIFNGESNPVQFSVQRGSNPLVTVGSQIASILELSIFSGYTRDDVDLSKLMDADQQDLIVVAPSNTAITKLTLKPWQFPTNIDDLEESGTQAKEKDLAINDNISKFVRSHVVSYQKNYKATDSKFALLRSLNSPLEIDGDILLRRDKDNQLFVASISDMKYFTVKKIEYCLNGVVLIVDTCLSKP